MNIKKLLFIGTAVLKIVDIFKINARSMCCVAAFIACISCMCIILVSCTNVETSEPVTPELLPFDEEKMALIPAGSFFRGNRSAHPGGSIDEVPVYLITLTKSFLMRRTEVTQEEYEAVMGSHPAHFKGQDLPVEQVTWHEAIEFCNRLSHNEGLDSCYIYTADEIVCDFQAYGYRLPTEAEWEYACRAGTETDFYTGDMRQLEPPTIDSALNCAGWYFKNADRSTHNVGQKEPNEFGLHDMHGNVLEWCWDRYASKYYESSPRTNPEGPDSGDDRVLRGGSWGLRAVSCRSSARFLSHPGSRSMNYGFRIVRTY